MIGAFPRYQSNSLQTVEIITTRSELFFCSFRQDIRPEMPNCRRQNWYYVKNFTRGVFRPPGPVAVEVLWKQDLSGWPPASVVLREHVCDTVNGQHKVFVQVVCMCVFVSSLASPNFCCAGHSAVHCYKQIPPKLRCSFISSLYHLKYPYPG